jgi:acetyl esterase/lipase
VPLDRHARRFLEMLAAAGEARGRYDDVEERRSALTNLANLVDPPGTVEIGGVRDHLLAVADGHITLRVYSPLGAPSRTLPGILFFHGGGWVAGSLETHDGLCRRLSNETGCRVIAVDYRLAPQHPFPCALKDAVAALSHVSRNPRLFGIDPARLGVAGDSAGGTLAAVLCRLARDAARENAQAPKIAFQLLLCPILDLHGESAARRDLAQGYFLDSETLRRDLELYVPPDTALSDIRLSPLCAEEFADLPPAFIHTGQFDPFSDEGEEYAQRLGGFGVAVHGRAHPGMIHYFYCMPRMIPYALEAMRIIGTEIRYAVELPQLTDRRLHRRIRPELIRA